MPVQKKTGNVFNAPHIISVMNWFPGTYSPILGHLSVLYQRMVAKKVKKDTVAKTKNPKARKNFNNCIGNK